MVVPQSMMPQDGRCVLRPTCSTVRGIWVPSDPGLIALCPQVYSSVVLHHARAFRALGRHEEVVHFPERLR